MKLSNQQVDSLVEKAYNKRISLINKEKETLLIPTKTKIQKAIEDAKKHISKLPKDLQNVLEKSTDSYSKKRFQTVFDNIADIIERDALKACKLKTFDKNQLRQDIILATIDAVDLKDLCDKLGLEL